MNNRKVQYKGKKIKINFNKVQHINVAQTKKRSYVKKNMEWAQKEGENLQEK